LAPPAGKPPSKLDVGLPPNKLINKPALSLNMAMRSDAHACGNVLASFKIKTIKKLELPLSQI
jgi:hypothetical protein